MLFLETFTNDFRSFAQAVGWEEHQESSNSSALKVSNGGVYNKTKAVTDVGMNPFMTVLDAALYEYAKQLVENRSADVELAAKTKASIEIEIYFEQGPSRRCKRLEVNAQNST